MLTPEAIRILLLKFGTNVGYLPAFWLDFEVDTLDTGTTLRAEFRNESGRKEEETKILLCFYGRYIDL